MYSLDLFTRCEAQAMIVMHAINLSKCGGGAHVQTLFFLV